MSKLIFKRTAMEFAQWVSVNKFVYCADGTWIRNGDGEYDVVADSTTTLYYMWMFERDELPKYLVRPSDNHVFEIDPSNYRYRSVYLRNDPNRPQSYPHFTYENLTMNHKFFPIREDQLGEYLAMDEELKRAYSEHLSHGISYGCTIQEFAAMKRDPNKYRDEPVNQYRPDTE
jgi:hypothetical protein